MSYNRTIGVDVPSYVVTVPFPTGTTVGTDRLVNCGQFIGYLAVYRICMGVASFFLVMMLMMLCVLSSKDPRSYIQNGSVGSYIHTYTHTKTHRQTLIHVYICTLNQQTRICSICSGFGVLSG